MNRGLAFVAAMSCLTLAAPAAAVVNGTKVDPATVPWFVSVSGCGGTLVTPTRVLTAAHCVRDHTPADLGAVTIAGQRRTYTRFAMHPNWRHANGNSNHLDDVAIVELSAPATGVPTVQLGSSVEPEEAWILGRGRAYAPGLGHTEDQTLDASLRTAPLRSMTDAECAGLFKGWPTAAGERFDKRMRCSIDADGKAPLYSGCFGDSGGPLWTGTPDAPIQLGVVSWGGDRCGADHLPSVFADVARYRDFILAPNPTWAPTRVGKVTVEGSARSGHVLACRVPGYKPQPGTAVAYRWKALPPKNVLADGRTYKLRRADRGHRVACFVTASNDGGPILVGVASRLVR
jgi:hypothetical protein